MEELWAESSRRGGLAPLGEFGGGRGATVREMMVVGMEGD